VIEILRSVTGTFARSFFGMDLPSSSSTSQIGRAVLSKRFSRAGFTRNCFTETTRFSLPLR